MAEGPDEVRMEFLRKHLAVHYGVDLVTLKRLQRGALALHLTDVRHWVARIFSPNRRALGLVEGDAAIMQFLEQNDVPAERCAIAAPVSVLGDRTILLADFISSSRSEAGLATLHAFGDLLGRIHLLHVPSLDGPLNREAGSLHHYVPGGGGLEAELKAADEWLDTLQEQVPQARRGYYDRLREQLATADAGCDLPQAIIHPDPALKNLLEGDFGEPVLIDWTGAGQGPRLASFALLIWTSAREKRSWSAQRVDAVVAGYRSRISLEPLELERLEAVMRTRPLVFACWRYCHAVRSARVPDGSEWWWPDELIQAVASRAVMGLRQS